MEAWRVGWKTKAGTWRYILCHTKADMVAEVVDKTTLSDNVSVRKVSVLRIKEGAEQ